ncbi:DUF4965 domain-containing protein [Aeoliella sp. ICT_H6.2]|uniref:DUF4965 domain-containing protein n=1 Tax=Aeoliella straminimaris TaxID=2954799 RepID=A0A9X2F586_9BACT|nr:glutaminase family protein [Aeoliella straminimaris]MCO6042497.1 DUF4965 domain-containing protein [Aeoliella straminimaris]
MRTNMMESSKTFLAALIFVAATTTALAQSGSSDQQSKWTPPAYPLVACDPYFSIWSRGKSIVDTDTTHWTGKPHRLASIARVDGKEYRLLGNTPSDLPALEQVGHKVLPTRSVFTLRGAGVEVVMTFTTPALPADIDLLSRPITYVSYQVRAVDGAMHDVQLMFGAAGEVAVNSPSQKVSAETVANDKNVVLRVGSVEQFVLGKSGDDLRIDWGYFYLAARDGMVQQAGIVEQDELNDLDLSQDDALATKHSEPIAGGELGLLMVLKPMRVNRSPQEQWLLLAYDDLYSIEFMHRKLRPYWRRNGLDGPGLVNESLRDYEELSKRCKEFDDQLVSDLVAAGGTQYADIACLAYRQCFAAGKFVADANGQPLQFSKENHSNGCIATSDVFYPMSPQFLLFGPSLAKSFVAPFMEYAKSDRWKFPFAPHDLGTYPKANGQVYGGGETSEENQMPVEECGNLLLLMGAIGKIDGNADFANEYWPTLVAWAEYLKKTGYDPESQLCTDDFAGHLAHNVNLSAKAICALGAFAQLCELRGDVKMAEEYRQVAKQYATQWIEEADDGDHFRLAFDAQDTWSQKYNLVWDRILGLGLFPDEVREKEMAYYRRVQNRYGLPLDNRREYTKLDWVLWTATLTQNEDDFKSLVRPVHRFLNETRDRAPMTDWYETKTGQKVGFTARPVVGGVFLPMLYDDQAWRKWAEQDETNAGGFADLPVPPEITVVVPAADTEPATWRYTTDAPQGDWQQADYDDSSWREGESGFGTPGTPGARIGTKWDSSDIWIRRDFDLPEIDRGKLVLHLHHDEDVEIYINGVLARKLEGYTGTYGPMPILAEALAALKPSGNVIAIHCHQTTGGQYIDAGLSLIDEEE